MLANIIAALIVILIVCAAVRYIVKAKKKGVKCIGCSSAGSCCTSHNEQEQSECSCGCHSEK